MDGVIQILGVILGIGFLIFIHELGHFAVAKWYDVKVEKFSIGFGPPIAQFTRGETVYALSWIPLGGYVSMLHEDDSSDDEDAKADPRAFPNQTVNARIAIMSAGVVMNVLFGLACFVALFGLGLLEAPPAVVGDVLPGSPAYVAGLRPGDEVVAIGDIDRDIDFERLLMAVALSGDGETLRLKVKRPGVENPVEIPLVPRTRPGDISPKIGVLSAGDNALFARASGRRPIPAYTPPPGAEPREIPAVPQNLLRDKDRVVALAPGFGPDRSGETDPEKFIPVANQIELRRLLQIHRAEPVTLKIERAAASSSDDAETPETYFLLLPPTRMLDFGLRMTLGPVVAVRKDSPAANAGIQPGDRIVAVDGDADFDPLRLPQLLQDRAETKTPVQLRVRRPANPAAENENQNQRTVAAPVDNPDDAVLDLEILPLPELDPGPRLTMRDLPLDLVGLGAACRVLPIVAGVVPDSPAAGLPAISPGDVVAKLTLFDATDPDAPPREIPIDFNDPDESWLAAINALQFMPRHESRVVIDGKGEFVIEAAPVDGWHNPDRGLRFAPLSRRMPKMSVGAAIVRGWEETVRGIKNIYYTILRIFQQRVSTKVIGGPIMIFDVGTEFIKQGWPEFLKFLGILSINLAVVNFLPISPLDGGRILLLLGEKIRGRPLPAPMLMVTERIGILLVLLLITFAVGQDLLRTFWGG